MGFVYIIHCESSGKSYAGITSKDVALRWKEHVSLMKTGCKKPLYAAMRKYGLGAFQVKAIAEHDDWDMLCAMEVYVISLFPEGALYNLTQGGDGTTGFRHDEATKKRIAKAGTGRPSTLTEDSKKRISLALKGRPLDSDHRAAVVAAVRSKARREKQRQVMTGRKVSEETRLKMSRSQTGKKRSKRTRDAIWETRWKNEFIALIKECATSL